MKKKDVKIILYVNIIGFFLCFIAWAFVKSNIVSYDISKYISASIIFIGFIILAVGNGLIMIFLLPTDSSSVGDTVE